MRRLRRCTCVWNLDLETRLLPDPFCKARRHADDEPTDDREEETSQ